MLHIPAQPLPHSRLIHVLRRAPPPPINRTHSTQLKQNSPNSHLFIQNMITVITPADLSAKTASTRHIYGQYFHARFLAEPVSVFLIAPDYFPKDNDLTLTR